MKIAIIMPPLHPMPPSPGGGVERLCDILLRGNENACDPLEITVFSRFDEAAFEAAKEFLHTRFIYLETTKSEPASNKLHRAVMRKLGQSMPVRYDYLHALKRAMTGLEFDAILLENCIEFAQPIYRFTGKKPILHAHDAFFGDGFPDMAKSYGIIKRFIFVSDYLMNAAISAGVPAEKSGVLHDCVDTTLFDSERYAGIRAEKRGKYGLTDDDTLGVYVGRLVPEKGAVELVKALAQTTDIAPELKLLIVGPVQYGEDIRDEYREMLENAAPEGRVIFIGGVRQSSAARFLARADFAVVPSIAEEPAALPVLEAMAIGLPLIVSDSGGIGEYAGEYIQAGGCTVVKRGLGYVTSLAKAMEQTTERLHREPEWREAIAKTARALALNYDSSGYYEKFITMIEREFQ